MVYDTGSPRLRKAEVMVAKKRQTQRGRPTQDELDLRKSRVLEVAGALFISRGFSATSVAEIARRSRVSPRLVAGHFGDKEQIFAQTITERTANASGAFAIPTNSSDLDQILFDAAKFAWDLVYSPPSISFLRMLVGEGDRFQKMTAEIADKSSRHFFNTLESLFTDLIARGLVEPEDPAKLAKYFVDLVVGFSLVQAGMGYWDRVSDDDELRDKIRFFRQAITKPTAPSRPATKKR